MDKWILSRLNSVIKRVDEGLTELRIPESAGAIQDLVDDLSNWYVRRGRSRFWGKGMAGDKEAAFVTLATVLTAITKLIAPFTPFLAENLYQNLVRTVDQSAPESVHLCAFPTADVSRIDPEMERQMEELLRAVTLGRACRNLANMKVRQPSAELYVKGVHFGPQYSELLKDELNVKQIVFTDDASDFIGYALKPQLRTLGPRYGKLLGKISQKLKEIDGTAAVAGFDRGEELSFDIDGTRVVLSRDDVLVESAQKPGLATLEDRGVTVALNTVLTPELLQEGYAREIISKLQTMRKDAGFEVTDRILVTYQASDALTKAIEAQKDMVMAVVLALELTQDEPQEAAFTQEWDINGEKAVLSIKVT